VEQGFPEYLESWHRYGSRWDLWVEEYERIRQQFAAFIGASPEEIAILPYMSAAIGSIASSSRHDSFRVSLHLYNAVEDVDALLCEIGRNRSLFNVRPRIAELDVNAAMSR